MSGNQEGMLPPGNDDWLLIDECKTHTKNIIIIFIPQRAH